MDPFLGAILLAWFLLRGPAEDAWYSVKRQESPRAKTRRELQERKGGSVSSKLAHAAADRLAQRIANPKEKTSGPLRTYLSHLWADALAARDDHRAQRAEDRRRAAAGDTGDTPDTPEGVHVDDNGQDSGQEQSRRKWWQWNQPKPQPEPEPEAETAPQPVRAIAERLDIPPEPQPPADHEDIPPDTPRTWADRYGTVLTPDQKDLVNRLHTAWSHGKPPESVWGAHEWRALPLGVRADLLDVATNAGLGQPVFDDLAAEVLERRRDKAEKRDHEQRSVVSPRLVAAPAAATTPLREEGEHPAPPKTPVDHTDHRQDPRNPTQQGDPMTTTPGEDSLTSYLNYTSEAGMQGAATEMRRQRVRVRSLLIVHRATVSNVTRRTIYNHADLLDRNRGQRGGHRFRPVPEQAPSLIGRGRRGLEKNGAHAPGVFRGYSEHTLGV